MHIPDMVTADAIGALVRAAESELDRNICSMMNREEVIIIIKIKKKIRKIKFAYISIIMKRPTFKRNQEPGSREKTYSMKPL